MWSADAVIDARLMPSNPTDLEQLFNRAKVFYMTGQNQRMSEKEIMDAALDQHCLYMLDAPPLSF